MEIFSDSMLDKHCHTYSLSLAVESLQDAHYFVSSRDVTEMSSLLEFSAKIVSSFPLSCFSTFWCFTLHNDKGGHVEVTAENPMSGNVGNLIRNLLRGIGRQNYYPSPLCHFPLLQLLIYVTLYLYW